MLINFTFQPISLSKKQNEIILSKSQDKFFKHKKLSPEEKKNTVNDNKNTKKFDKERIETLYKNYQEKKKKLASLRIKTDAENGITFCPQIFTSDNYNVHYFKECPKRIPLTQRSEEYILHKNNYINNKLNEHFQYQKPKKNYTEKEKIEITNNIINRLYNNGLQKQLSRNLIELNNKNNINTLDNKCSESTEIIFDSDNKFKQT